jgi:hypothetical protein
MTRQLGRGSGLLKMPVVIAALSAALATACTTTSAGTPLPGSTSPSSVSPEQPTPNDELPSDGAPKVENPLDVSRFEQNPCEALTAEDAQGLNLPTTGEPTEVAFGNGCQWRNKQTQGSAGIQFFSSIERGLSAVYAEAKGSDFPYFEPIDDIEGYPAVAFDTKVAKPVASCTVAVGVADQLVFDVVVDLSDANLNKKDPCELAIQVAGMMMNRMQEAA